MSLGFPLGLLALLALLPLLAAYFLRRKQPPLKVSALFLWRVPQPQARAGPRFQRFSRELSLLLEALALIAAAVFLADARCGKTVERRHTVVVVDNSFSMSATLPNGVPLPERVRQRVAEWAHAEDASALTVVATGTPPRVLAGPQEDVSRALATLEGWRPQDASHDVGPALLLARELGGAGHPVHFLTDALPGENEHLPPEVQVEALGQPLENLAFVSAQRRDEGEIATVTVRVANFSGTSRDVTVRFDSQPAAQGSAPGKDGGSKALHQEQPLSLPSGGSEAARVSFRNVGPVTVTLPQDALSADGNVTLLPAIPRLVPIRLLTGLTPTDVQALERFFAVAPGVVREGPARLSFGPRGSDATVTLGAPGKARSFVGPFFADKNHPALEDVDLSGVVWTAGENPPGRPLLSAGDAVLLSEEEPTLHFNLDLSRSNLQRTGAWPILLGNLLQRARARLPGVPRPQAMLGESMTLFVEPGARWAVAGPGGTKPLLGSGLVSLPPFQKPGRYQVLRDGAPLGDVEVLPLDPRESDLRGRGTGERAARGGNAAPSTARERRAPWALLVMLGLLLADFAVTRRGGT